jgi:hypothetical protein
LVGRLALGVFGAVRPDVLAIGAVIASLIIEAKTAAVGFQLPRIAIAHANP